MPERRFWLFVAAAIALVGGLPSDVSADSPRVLTASLDGDINAATSAYLSQVVARAQSERAAALVVVMNTPGGISTAMDEMVTTLLNSRVPTIVYVSPAGARADSAGLFVAQAADLIAMVPGTNTGSAHPINASGANIGGDLEEKVVNDAVTRIRQLAASHGRNADWCERAVRESVNVSSAQAVSMHVADLEARDMAALLDAIEGRELPRPHASPVTLHVSGAVVEDFPMPLQLRFLQLLANPNVAYMLLLVAIFGLMGELTLPGAILPGTVGVISAILSLIAFSTLPVNLGGVLLLVFALVLFVLDLKAPTHGVLTAGGVVSLALGSAFLVNPGPLGLGISPWLVAGAALACAGFFGFVLGKAVGARRRPAYDVAAPVLPPRDGEGAR